ncbi:MAG: adenylate/guanylate cyclase domain-containing protein [Nocardioides sp.]
MATALGVRTCTHCGADLPERARFCLECGTPVVAAHSAEARKTVTLLFTDVTGSTALGERLDPEALRAVMGRYFDLARAAIEAHGGTVEKFVGDAVLAVFGVPEVREDDALRAVRAAHQLVADVRQLSDDLMADMGVGFQVRTGVNTGPVITGDSRAGGSFATGDAVNTAARLEQAAAPGEVLIGGSTYALVKDAVRVVPVDPIHAKGKAEPVAAYRLLDVDSSAPGLRRRLEATLVGRVRETRVLQDALDRTIETGRGHVVTILGGPGLGKTRLVAEFLSRLDGRARVLTGRCVSYGQGTSYWPVVQVLRDAASLDGSESPEVTAHALGQLVPDPDAVGLLLPVLGKGGEPGAADQTSWAVTLLLEQLALAGPLVIDIDDLHWADTALVDLLVYVRDEVADLPLLLVCQARPELLDTHPGWAGGAANAVSLSLEPFGRDDTAASVAAIVGGSLDPAVVDAVERWSGGNPLFVEEIATHLVETARLEPEGDGWRLIGDAAKLEVPPSVSALLAARIERLPSDERSCLSRISVIGLELTTAQAQRLAESADDSTPRLLAALARRDLLRRVRSVEGDTWTFRHLLIREAAYDALPKTTRIDLHQRLADHLVAHPDEGGSTTLAFVAHHLAQAARCAAELGSSSHQVASLAEDAVRAAIEASDDARVRDDTEGAASLLTSVLNLSPPVPVRRQHLMRLLYLQFGLFRAGDIGPTLEALELVTGEAHPETAELDAALLAVLRLQLRMAGAEPLDPALLVKPAKRLLQLADAVGDARCSIVALRTLFDVDNMAGRWGVNHQDLQRILELGDTLDQRVAQLSTFSIAFFGPAPMSRAVESAVSAAAAARGPSRVLHARGSELLARVASGERDSASELSDVVAEFAANEATADPLSMVLHFEALRVLGRDAEAVEVSNLLVDAFVAAGELGFASTHRAMGVLYAADAGAPVAALAARLEEAAGWTSPYDALSVALVATGRALVAADAGDHESASQYAREAERAIDGGDSPWYQGHVLRWLSRAARAAGRDAEEKRLLSTALELFRNKQVVLWTEQMTSRLAEL